jgi:hypothetical protein
MLDHPAGRLLGPCGNCFNMPPRALWDAPDWVQGVSNDAMLLGCGLILRRECADIWRTQPEL